MPEAGWERVAFAAELVVLDVAMRGGFASAVHACTREPRWLASAVASVAVGWLVATACGRAGRWTSTLRWIVALVWGALVAVDAFVFRYYHVPIDAQVAASAAHAWRDVAPVVVRALPLAAALAAALSTLNAALLGLGAPAHARPSGPSRRTLAVVGAVGMVGVALGPPPNDGTPEMRAVAALVSLGRTDTVRSAAATTTPALVSSKPTLPSVLFVLTESVRALDACSGHPQVTGSSDRCATTPRVDALLPDRAPLAQMRSVSSYTALAFAALLTGRAQAAPREELARAPTLFDLVHAIRAPDGRGLTVAYWSAQSDTIFEGSARHGVDSFVSLETLTGRRYDEDPVDTGFDRLLFARADRELPSLEPPYFLFLHLFGTHAPYFVDEGDAPFGPWDHTVSWAGLPALHAAYRDAIHAQDAGLAGLVRAFVAAQGERPWAIVLTSDHGEAFGEHGAIHHGQNLYEEQIHVPAFVATSPGLLSPDQAASLRANRDRFVTHLDLLPTVLDLYGVLDALPLAPVRAALEGESLLRTPSVTATPVPITNCTAMFPCPVNAWGMLAGDHVLEAQVWDGGWRCFALVPDPVTGGETAREEPRDVGTDETCRALERASTKVYPTLPNRSANLASR